MHQLTQQLKSGQMEILEVPFPTLNEGQVLVRNHFSVISAGTEGKTVSDARKGYIAKARSRQKEVQQVVNMIKTNGLRETYRLVMNKLEAPSPLGYSCAGEVIAVGKGVTDIEVGDFVACGGQGAYHADIVSVLRNLCVKVPKTIHLKHAAFATVASIAIQGIRQADVRLGETCAIIGLGLIGQITIQVLKASGIRVVGVDIQQEQVQAALKNGADLALNRNQLGIENAINDFTNGIGVDAVLITAGTSSLDPVNFAGEICRQRGKVVIVGGVPTGFERKNYYRKELDLRMSCSYGAGRYDANYEEKGIDYPAGLVRWTENRNMQTFIDLLNAEKLNIEQIITHTFELENAVAAYNMILSKSENFQGIVISYNTENQPIKSVILSEKKYSSSEMNVGFIGAGSFAQNILLPRLKGLCNFVGVATAHGNTSRYVADKYKFNYCTDNADSIINDPNINTIFIATRHNLHAAYVLKAIEAGKNVFVEKPLALNEAELQEIKSLYSMKSNVRLLIGYNRRFSPYTQKLMQIFPANRPKSMNFRINAGFMPKEHWAHDPQTGGGRIIGEGCHFIDLAMFIAGSSITLVSSNGLQTAHNLHDTVTINLMFENGSIANISYFSNGNKSLSKEYYEIFCDGQVAIIEDFSKMSIYGKSVKKYSFGKQQKGHKEELIAFADAIKTGKQAPISFEDLHLSTLASFKVLESIQSKRNILIEQ